MIVNIKNDYRFYTNYYLLKHASTYTYSHKIKGCLPVFLLFCLYTTKI